jgi:DNA-damage-inducible protein J
MKMNKTEIVRARIEPDLKHDAEAILKVIGISSSQAISMFYKQIIFNQGLPFEVKAPNEETQQVLLDAMMGRNMSKPISLDEFMKKYS